MIAPELKFCGLTRAADAAVAAELGAAYAGVIFAGGPRLLDAAGANAVFAGLGGSGVRRVGVFGAAAIDEVVRTAEEARLDVLQLHDGGTPDRVLLLRERFDGAIWVAVRVTGAEVEPVSELLLASVDALVLDTAVGGRSGGTGVAFDWSVAAPAIRVLAARSALVLAGGLRPGNVRAAVRMLAPRVVDVSSGVESAPGIKDPELMRAFAAAARSPEE